MQASRTLRAAWAEIDLDALWRNADQQGKALLEDGKATEAQQKFATPAWRGVAAFEAGDYAAAAEAFEQSEQADASYNRGNALARAGELQAALEAYDAQLAERPDHADAQYNRELIQALLDQQQQQQQQGDGGDNSDSNQQSEQQGKEKGLQDYRASFLDRDGWIWIGAIYGEMRRMTLCTLTSIAYNFHTFDRHRMRFSPIDSSRRGLSNEYRNIAKVMTD